MRNLTYTLAFFLSIFTTTIFAQSNPTLSIQGTVQNSNGAAVDDGSYSLTFKLYTVASGGSAIWTETQSGIPIKSGVYSAELGSVTALNVAFDAAYYLGVSVNGGQEMAPRAKLTSAPYALSLRGQENVFGSTGSVGIGDATPDTKLHVKDGTNAIIRAEAPGIAAFELNRTNGTNATIGYIGTGTLQVAHGSGPIDIRAKNDTKVFHDNTEKLAVNTNGIYVNGKAQLANNGDLELGAGGNIKYGANDDWRLVDVDDFSTGNDGWDCQNSLTDAADRDIHRTKPGTPFSKGWLIGPATTNTGDSDDVLYKQFDLTGIPHSKVKVVFTYHISGEFDAGEYGFGAFSTAKTRGTSSNNNGNFQIGWTHHNDLVSSSAYNGLGYIGTTNSHDYNVQAEMVANLTDNTFYVLIGAYAGAEALTDERYYISDVEIWVK